MNSFIPIEQELLGINERNLRYGLRVNSRTAIRNANHKLLTKHLLTKANLPVPRTYAVIRDIKELQSFAWEVLPISFVLKPNRGIGGEGIIIIYGKRKGAPVWIRSGQRYTTVKELAGHTVNILEGTYSLSNSKDIALIEQRVRLARFLKQYTAKGGIPDIRVIVYERVPVMAMLRLPTLTSDGKANLAMGAIGVGIDMRTGITTHAIQHNVSIVHLPGTRLRLGGIVIPHWSAILELAIQAQLATDLGFAGIDIAIDREEGPVVLEVNARPGLKIQLANLMPLRSRLMRIEGLSVKTVKRGVRLAKELFGGEQDHKLEELAEKTIIGTYEPVQITTHKGIYTTTARIDTGAMRSAIDRSLAKRLGLTRVIGQKYVRSSMGRELRDIIELEFVLAGKRIQAQAFLADRPNLTFEFIIGRRDLKGFIIDPDKKRSPLST